PNSKRLTIIGFSIVLAMFFIVANVAAQADKSGNPKISSRSVHTMATGAIVPSAGSTLFRNQDGVYFDFHTSSLTPGLAVSAWMAVFNNPEFCARNPCRPADVAQPCAEGTR